MVLSRQQFEYQRQNLDSQGNFPSANCSCERQKREAICSDALKKKVTCACDGKRTKRLLANG